MTPIATPMTSSPAACEDTGTADLLLAICKASADQLRLEILRVLSRDSFGVLELCAVFDCKQSGMSHHLKILAGAGLVTTRREGNSIFYRRTLRAPGDGLYELQQALFAAVDALPIHDGYQQRIAAIQSERAANSQVFFRENADKFRQQQEQIAAYELYGPNTIDLMKRCQDKRWPRGKVLELGPGEGAFLAELSPCFADVYALDNSPQMLEKSSALATAAGLNNIRFIEGDTKHPTLRKLRVDCVVVNMVLHHIPSPAEIFFDLAAVLKQGGQLYVTDLCRHDQDWVRSACGDWWLGFEPEDLSRWATDAGLESGESIFLAQRNGFRVQIRQFIKN